MELNEKLARWAGFTFLPYKFYPNLGKLNDSCWLEPSYTQQSQGHWSFSAPNFTGSLDLCFQWLVPKLRDFGLLEISFHYSFSTADDDELVLGFACRLHVEKYLLTLFCAYENTPSLALCKAIEQLMDKQEET